jgi:hypothetical protein
MRTSLLKLFANIWSWGFQTISNFSILIGSGITVLQDVRECTDSSCTCSDKWRHVEQVCVDCWAYCGFAHSPKNRLGPSDLVLLKAQLHVSLNSIASIYLSLTRECKKCCRLAALQ